MFTLHCTQKLRDRIKADLALPSPCDTMLGNWYATALFWKPQVALLVSERTLLPVLMPLAPANTLARRFPTQLALVLKAHGIGADAIAQEIWRMGEVAYAKTVNRSVVGMLNEFSFLAECWRPRFGEDLVALSQRLAETPCGPLRKGPMSPDRALRDVMNAEG
ncbi:MAG: hypothetical protein KGJ57_21595 [Sphingomonadales bacterium]|nr:hypothetical protein [Sphingomonadales bacterium]MDE2171987.1 hypothetical protein [Sphingomonadales bacterium]